MCSISWIWGPEDSPTGYQLWFNRDEQWSRPVSLPIEETREVEIPGLCSRDPEQGGTWLYVNTYGLTAAVMNGDRSDLPAPGLKSRTRPTRGLLPLLASRYPDLRSVELALGECDLTDYAPFFLVLVAPGEAAALWSWDRNALEPLGIPDLQFWTTSSKFSADVIEARTRRFRELAGPAATRDARLSERAHRDTADAQGYRNIHMTREDAGTVSLGHIAVGAEAITYWLERRGLPPEQRSLPRRVV